MSWGRECLYTPTTVADDSSFFVDGYCKDLGGDRGDIVEEGNHK